MLRYAVLALCAAIAIPAPAWSKDCVPADRWMEIDLYWFDSAHIDRSVDQFWNRYEPLYQNVCGYRGVVLSVGLTTNYIMTFSGDLDQPISLPKTSGQELGASYSGQLAGDTATRQDEWRARFASHDNTKAQVGYGSWTYAQLAQLARTLRSVGAKRGISQFKVATLAVANESAYGEFSPFALAHPEAWTRWGPRAKGGYADANAYFNPAARLKEDPKPLAGLLKGISEGLPLHTAFAAQWGALSRQVGLDGLMLRDGFGFSRAYTREGPWGEALPDVATGTALTDAVATMVRELKQANPHALTMMYSTAATTTADWRANGIDLEKIADEGYLDIFVDQTWAGAWGDVGIRQQTFWNAPILGWTYQLNYLLQHAAVLAKSRVHHYHLVETFDAWESWDVIHTDPGRLRWGVWAYSHAGVKMPGRIRMPEGAYISWTNHGHALLDQADVANLRDDLNAAERDAADVTEIFGPTIVYSRDAARQQMVAAASGSAAHDRMDETVGSLIKWQLPVQSITRVEWLPKVSSDLFLFGATKGIDRHTLDTIGAMARGGQPMAFLSEAGSDTDPLVANIVGIKSQPHDPPQEDQRLRAIRGDGPAPAISNALETFEATPTATQVSALAGTMIYGFGKSAALVVRQDHGLNVSFWEPAPLDDTWFVPLRKLMDDNPTPFALASAAMTEQLAHAGKFRASRINVDQSGTIAAWRTGDGKIRLLTGNLEEGLRDDADQSRLISVGMPHSWTVSRWRPEFGKSRFQMEPSTVQIMLDPAESASLRSQ